MQGKLSFTGRIASFSFRHKWYVLAVWLLLLVGSGVAASGLGSVLTTEFKDLSGSDAATAQTLIDDRYGERPLMEMVVVRSDTDTVDSPTFQQLVRDLGVTLGTTTGVAQVQTYLDTGDPSMVSADRHAALTRVTLAGDRETAEKEVSNVVDAITAAPRPAGYALTIGGESSMNHEFNTIAEEDIAKGESVGLPVALIVMVLAFGSAVAAVVPLLLGVAAIFSAIGTVALIGRAFELSFFVTQIITMMGLAVGIDYSLFIIGRYREELKRGHDRPTALGLAADSSGRAVFFSGVTVLLALCGMLLVRDSVFISIGIGAMVVVAYAIVASLTLLPAILGILGRGINWVRIPFLGKAGYGSRFWGMVTDAVQKHPAVYAIGAVVLLVAAALPLFTIELGSNGPETLPTSSGARRSYDALRQDFSGGLTSPLYLLVDGEVNSPVAQQAIGRLQTAVQARPDLQWISVTPDDAGRTAIIEIAAKESGTTPEAQAVVRDMRENMIPQAFDGSGVTTYLGGWSAAFLDSRSELDAKTPIVFGFVLGLSFLLLLIVFRSIFIPAKAILMNLLSVGAAYGLIVAVFQHGFLADQLGLTQTPQIDSWIPLFLFSILFGLSMDYHIFLLSRVKEEYTRTGDNKLAVSLGVRATAGMITSAAIIMVAVFGAFAAGRLVGVQQVGFGLAVAVFLDATIIRSVLVPASMQLLGRFNWWMPSWLNWLPRLNIEGTHAPVPQPQLAGAAGDD